jgi:excisionase family DNA binding protein
MSDTQAFWSLRDLAAFLQVSRGFAWKLIDQGAIPSMRIGRAVRVRPEDAAKYVEEHTTAVPEPVGVDRALLASKVRWEGGILATLEYGIRSDEIADPLLAEAWQRLEVLYDQIRPLLRHMALLLSVRP